MKAITLWQPWAQLVAIGEKTVETRSWPTKYRGEIAIHAAKNLPSKSTYNHLRSLSTKADGSPSVLGPFQDLPKGCIVAIAELHDVQPTPMKFEPYMLQWLSTPREYAYGNFSPGRYMWFLKNIKGLDKPIPAKGYQRIWEWEEE